MNAATPVKSPPAEPIAIIGFAGRFPGARDVAQFWENLREGVESITTLTDEQLAAAGVPAALRAQAGYVRRRPLLDGVRDFDAAFFGYAPHEAARMDPQHRLFLETAWEAFEHAGYDTERHPGAIGVFAGSHQNAYLLGNLCHGREEIESFLGCRAANSLPTLLGNDKDFLTSRVAYKLNLRGPAITVQTACSTSLVAVVMACDSLRAGQTDLALAGGVAVLLPEHKGYLAQEGGIQSPDGRCRSFDAAAQGTVFGSGVGAVVLKRLSNALADGDTVHAVIRGAALNNDGAAKTSYTAPGLDGQAAVIRAAQEQGGVAPETIGYVEAHGTGTALGDPVEVAALTQAFRLGTARREFCALGAVKPNIGHLDAAAGIASLLKAILVLREGQIPPTLHFERANPQIDFATTPFRVVTKLTPWPRPETGARRAAVSAFGVGGTNAHVVLEEPPPLETAAAPPTRPQLLLLSARTPAALEAAAARLAAHLRTATPELADVAYTLQVGRRALPHRLMLVARDAADALALLERPEPRRVVTERCESRDTPVVFLFPGQGSHYAGMGAGLYASEPVFREQVALCAGLLRAHLDLDVTRLIAPAESEKAWAEEKLARTRYAQPALFTVEYALARLWMSWGVQPAALLGHSLGEYVAATLAGVFTPGRALELVAERARLMDARPPGAMLAVRLPEAELGPLLGESLDLAAVNAANLCVASGPRAAIAELEERLRARGVPAIRLNTSHAFHSAAMESVVAPFARRVRKRPLLAPTLPIVSSVTGRALTEAEATDPDYWAGQLRRPVRFADALGSLCAEPCVLLEVGPGGALATLARQHPARTEEHLVLGSIPSAREPEPAALRHTLGRLWLAGVSPVWPAVHGRERRRRVPLPTYPFERQRHWVEPQRERGEPAGMPPVTASDDLSTPTPISNMPAALCERPLRHLPALAQLFRELTGLEFNPAECARPFLELGLDSLFLTQARQALQERFGVQVTFRQLQGETPTLRALAEWLEECVPGAAASATGAINLPPADVAARHAPVPPAPAAPAAPGFDRLEALLQRQLDLLERLVEARVEPPVPEMPSLRAVAPANLLMPESEKSLPARPSAPTEPAPAEYPLTDAQREIWLACQFGAEASCAFNEATVVTLRGPLAPELLIESLQEVVARHDVLRTTIDAAGERQRIAPSLRLVVPRTDWSHLGNEERDAHLAALTAQDLEEPFDLVRGPLVRARLLKLGDHLHRLMFTAHHVICDGETAALLVRELGRHYTARQQGRSLAAEPAVQFHELARHARTLADSKPAERFWRAEFATIPEPLALPAQHPRGSDGVPRGAVAREELSADTVRELKRLSAKHGGTLFTALLAAYQAWLLRLAGQEEVVVGVCNSLRGGAGLTEAMGHAVNTLPLRTRAAHSLPFSTFLHQVNRLVSEAREHAGYTYGRLLQRLQLSREPGRAPLIDAIFNLSRQTDGAGHFHHLEVAAEPTAHGFVTFDLFLNARELPDHVLLDLEYRADLFDADCMQQWLTHFRTMIEAAVASPEMRLAELPLLSAAERRRVLQDWNRTALDFPRQACLHELFEAQVEATPDAVALVCGPERLTYRELNRCANRLANHLRAHGVLRESLVGLCLDRTWRMVAAVLGVLKAGGAYVPLDPAHPRERIDFIARDAGLRVIVTEEAVSARLPESGRVERLCLDRMAREIARESAENPGSASDAANLAYVLYTSGSTGRPKGVAIEHRSVGSFVQWAAGVFSRHELGGVLAGTTLTFDLSVFELFVPLCRGGKVVLAPNVLALAELPEASEVRLINTVPSAMTELLRLGAVPESVVTVNLAGEPVAPELVDQLYALPHIRRVNDLYGPTEATIYATHAVRQAGAAATIGRPIANLRAHILDRHFNPVPVGVPGELLLGGEGLARGYLHQPGLTAEKFVRDPFATDPTARLYRTGDLCRYRSDGQIEFIGRIDHQLKIRGHRIEPGEIESALAAHAAVEDCVVVGREDQVGDRRLVAYVVPCARDRVRTGAAELVATLREHLIDKVPPYMVPDAIVPLAEMPRTPTGKLDRKALPPPGELAPAEREFVAPESEVERAIAAVWREVLGHDRVGVGDNFFLMGGHSLLASRAVVRLREVFALELPVAALFNSPTVASLAREVERRLGARLFVAHAEDRELAEAG